MAVLIRILESSIPYLFLLLREGGGVAAAKLVVEAAAAVLVLLVLLAVPVPHLLVGVRLLGLVCVEGGVCQGLFEGGQVSKWGTK